MITWHLQEPVGVFVSHGFAQSPPEVLYRLLGLSHGGMGACAWVLAVGMAALWFMKIKGIIR